MSLVKRERTDLVDAFRRILGTELEEKDWMRVEEFVDDKTVVVRAELPGIDPQKDVEVSVVDGSLVIRAEREERSEQRDKDSYRSEFHYGSFIRAITLPRGYQESEITATYRDGVLEVRAPIGEAVEPAHVKIPITRG